MTRLYHVTKKSNLNNIMQNGIVPHLGKNAKDCGETTAAIWLFPDETTMNDAIGSWFEDLCIEDMYCLEVEVPDNLVYKSTVDYEKIVFDRIKPEWIKKVFQVW